jgi:hypothetical protein
MFNVGDQRTKRDHIVNYDVALSNKLIKNQFCLDLFRNGNPLALPNHLFYMHEEGMPSKKVNVDMNVVGQLIKGIPI